MARVARLKQSFYVYQGSGWGARISLGGTSAPADLVGWDIYMDWRSSTSPHSRIIKRFSLDLGNITITPDEPEFVINLPYTETRDLPPGKFFADLFLKRPDTSEIVAFATQVEIDPRVTRTEELQ